MEDRYACEGIEQNQDNFLLQVAYSDKDRIAINRCNERVVLRP